MQRQTRHMSLTVFFFSSVVLFLCPREKWLSFVTLLFISSLRLSLCKTVRPGVCVCVSVWQTGGWAALVSLLAGLLLLLETEAGPPAQFTLLLSKVVGPRRAGPRLQDIVHLWMERYYEILHHHRNTVSRYKYSFKNNYNSSCVLSAWCINT